MTTPTERPDDAQTTTTPSAIRDLRTKPRGVLPRHVQMWLMVGIAVIILAIILFAGRTQPLPRPQAGSRPAQPTLVPPDRVRSYEQQLAADLAREQQALEQAASGARATRPAGTAAAVSADPTIDDQRRRDYQSLFADNVALSRRPPDRQPFGEPRQQITAAPSPASTTTPEVSLLEQLLARNAGAPAPTRNVPPLAVTPTAAAPAPSVDPQRPGDGGVEGATPPKETAPIRSSDPLQRLLEGTVIETVLVNRLDGTFAGPVECLVTTAVYSHDRQLVVIPAGARVLGAASPVQTWGDSRLAVSFHRLIMPDGRTYSLDRFKGLGQSGDTGLKDSVNRHYFQVFGASLAIGALSGLAQFGTRGSVDAYSFGDSYRQATGSSLAASAGRVLDRYLNVLPTITIREGYRVKVYLTNDLQLPPYAPVTAGGSQ